eukprot:SM000026S08867  [mRNA]  locus=s26:283543:286897:+ [translate_table: standard]
MPRSDRAARHEPSENAVSAAPSRTKRHAAAAASAAATAAAAAGPEPAVLAERNLALENELASMTMALEKVSLEKRHAETLLQEREASLLQKAEEAKKLAGKVKDLQKTKVFAPKLDIIPQTTAEPDGKKERRDPNKPKPPASTFLLWCNDHRGEISKKHPNATFGELSAVLGEAWKAVSEKEKLPYVAAAEVESTKYKTAKEEYEKNIASKKRETDALIKLKEEKRAEAAMDLLRQFELHQLEAQEIDGKPKKKEKDDTKPKAPVTAFFEYCKQRRTLLASEGISLTVPEAGKKLGEEWNLLSEKQKAPYEEVAAADRARYTEEMVVYKLQKQQELEAIKALVNAALAKDQEEARQMICREDEELAKVAAKATTLAKLSVPKQPKVASRVPDMPKRPPTGYILFSNSVRQGLAAGGGAKLSLQEATGIISNKWQALGEDEKGHWAQVAAPAWNDYKAAMKAYRLSHPDMSDTESVPGCS